MRAKHPPKHSFLLFFGIGLVSFMTGVDLLGTGLALTPISHQFGVNFSTLQWFLTAFAMGNSSFLVTSGKLIDIYGSRRIFSLGVMLFVASSISITLTPNFYIICIERFIQGTSCGLMGTAATSIISTDFPAKERTHWMAGLIGMVGLGMALGPIIGGYLIETFYWQAIFWVKSNYPDLAGIA